MLRLLFLALLLPSLSGCADLVLPLDDPGRGCHLRAETRETKVTSERGEHDIRTPKEGYMTSGSYAEVGWVWGARAPVLVEVEATWPDGPLGAEPMRIRLGKPFGEPLYGDAEGTSPLALRFLLDEAPTTRTLGVLVEPSADPALPAGAAVVLEERDTHVVVRQTLLCP